MARKQARKPAAATRRSTRRNEAAPLVPVYDDIEGELRRRRGRGRRVSRAHRETGGLRPQLSPTGNGPNDNGAARSEQPPAGNEDATIVDDAESLEEGEIKDEPAEEGANDESAFQPSGESTSTPKRKRKSVDGDTGDAKRQKLKDMNLRSPEIKQEPISPVQASGTGLINPPSYQPTRERQLSVETGTLVRRTPSPFVQQLLQDPARIDYTRQGVEALRDQYYRNRTAGVEPLRGPFYPNGNHPGAFHRENADDTSSPPSGQLLHRIDPVPANEDDDGAPPAVPHAPVDPAPEPVDAPPAPPAYEERSPPPAYEGPPLADEAQDAAYDPLGSPLYTPASPLYAPGSPQYAPGSPQYAPGSPYEPYGGAAAFGYAPAFPAFGDPAAPGYRDPAAARYNDPTSPYYRDPAAARYNDPTSPYYRGPAAARYNDPTSPYYRGPANPRYNDPTSPYYRDPIAPIYNDPTSPYYRDPLAPGYSPPASPGYSDHLSSHGGGYAPISPGGASPSTVEKEAQDAINEEDDRVQRVEARVEQVYQVLRELVARGDEDLEAEEPEEEEDEYESEEEGEDVMDPVAEQGYRFRGAAEHPAQALGHNAEVFRREIMAIDGEDVPSSSTESQVEDEEDEETQVEIKKEEKEEEIPGVPRQQGRAEGWGGDEEQDAI